MQQHGDALISPKQLAAWLGVSLRTIERIRHTGNGPAFNRVSGGIKRGRVMCFASEVRAWLEARQLQSTVAAFA